MNGKQERREFGRWWMWILLLVLVSTLILGATGQLGRVVDVVIQREVFENSFQYDQAREKEISTYDAQIAELEGRLLNPNLTESTRTEIEAQLSQLKVLRRSAIDMKNGQ